MRFVMMVFVSLFLMTTVSGAEPVNCPDLKKKIEYSYRNAGQLLKGSFRLRSEQKPEAAEVIYDDSNIELDAATKYATIYLALCKHFTAQRNDPLGIR